MIHVRRTTATAAIAALGLAGLGAVAPAPATAVLGCPVGSVAVKSGYVNTSPLICEARITATGTWEVPAGVTSIDAIVIGAGGGGGGGGGSYSKAGGVNTGSPNLSGGGGGGGEITRDQLTVTPGSTISVTIGTGGAGGTSPSIASGLTAGTNGGDGGSTTFGTLTSAGGQGGKAGSNGGGGGKQGGVSGHAGGSGLGAVNSNPQYTAGGGGGGAGGAGANAEAVTVAYGPYLKDAKAGVGGAGILFTADASVWDSGNFAANGYADNATYYEQGLGGGGGSSIVGVQTGGCFKIEGGQMIGLMMAFQGSIGSKGQAACWPAYSIGGDNYPNSISVTASFNDWVYAGIGGNGAVGNREYAASAGRAGAILVRFYQDGSPVPVPKPDADVTYTGTSGGIAVGEPMTLSSNVSPSDCTGTVTYSLDADPTGGATVPFALTAPVNTSKWKPGTYSVTAAYAADADCTAGSDTASITVTKATPTVTYTGTKGSVEAGSSLTLKSKVSPGACTGSVAYELTTDPTGGSKVPYPLASSPVSTTGWRAGSYTIRAVYAADSTCKAASDTESLKITASTPGAPKPRITGPKSQSAAVGDKATFSATATPATSLQWQRSTDDGKTWKDIAGATKKSYTTGTLAEDDDGTRYRLVATNAPDGDTPSSATSTAATLTVTDRPGPTPDGKRLPLDVKAKSRSFSIPRKGTVTLVSSASTTASLGLVMTRVKCEPLEGSARPRGDITYCTAQVSDDGRVRVTTLGWSNIFVRVRQRAVPTSDDASPSDTFVRTWTID